MRLICRAPLRIDLAGGWSDIPPFAERVGGAVLNVAISPGVEAEFRAVDEDDGQARDPLQGMRITYGMDLPAGSGLGSSAALSVAWLGLVRTTTGYHDTPDTLAAMACTLGGMLGVLGGKQDEYASAYGGLNLMRFTTEVTVERLALSPALMAELESRLVLCYSGRSRLSSEIHDRVWGAYQAGSSEVGGRLALLAETAVTMRDALVRGDLEGFGDLLEQNWQGQKALHDSITNPRVDTLFAAALRAGARSGKACGAGGGGCLVFFAPRECVVAVQEALIGAGGQVVPFRFNSQGVRVTREDE